VTWIAEKNILVVKRELKTRQLWDNIGFGKATLMRHFWQMALQENRTIAPKRCTHKLRVILLTLISFLFAASASWAATYYVDATSGSDAGDGLSPSTAWRTIAKINSFNFTPGSNVLLKRGETWHEALKLNVSGAPNNPIVVDAYGTGPNPKLLGSDTKTGVANWAQESPNIWFCVGVSWDPEMVFHDGVGSSRRAGKNLLASDWDWFYDTTNRRIYFYLAGNPGNHAIEVQRRNGVDYTAVSHIHLKNLEIAYASTGIGLWGANSWLIENVFIHNTGRNGIQGHNSTSSITVRNSVIQDWNWVGFGAVAGQGTNYRNYGIQVLDAVSGNSSQNWIISGNTFMIVNMKSGEDTGAIGIDQQGHATLIGYNTIRLGNRTGAGIMIWRPKGSGSITVVENVIDNPGEMAINISDLQVNNFVSEIILEKNIISNSCTADRADQEAVRIWANNGTPIRIRNNLVNRTAPGSNVHHGIRVRNSAPILYNNTVYGTDIGVSFEDSVVTAKNNISSGNRSLATNIFSSTVVETNNNWNGSVSGFVPDKTDMALNPLFANPDPKIASDFYLQENSACRDSGVNVGLPFAGTAPDMGAYEGAPKIQMPASPSNLRIIGF
jgi:hypothetical protein